jgi:hypothetical protein
MPRRALAIGGLAAIVVAAVIINLSLLDVITVSQLRGSLGRSLMVIAVTTAAIVLMVTIMRLGRPPQDSDQSKR